MHSVARFETRFELGCIARKGGSRGREVTKEIFCADTYTHVEADNELVICGFS